jgi:hypothetical protein
MEKSTSVDRMKYVAAILLHPLLLAGGQNKLESGRCTIRNPVKNQLVDV